MIIDISIIVVALVVAVLFVCGKIGRLQSRLEFLERTLSNIGGGKFYEEETHLFR